MSETVYHQFKLRLPLDLFERIETASVAANRSVSAEMIQRLESSFEVPEDVLGPEHPLRLRMKLGAYREHLLDTVNMLTSALEKPEEWLGPVDAPRVTETRAVFQELLDRNTKLLTEIAVAEVSGKHLDGQEILKRIHDYQLVAALQGKKG